MALPSQLNNGFLTELNAKIAAQAANRQDGEEVKKVEASTSISSSTVSRTDSFSDRLSVLSTDSHVEVNFKEEPLTLEQQLQRELAAKVEGQRKNLAAQTGANYTDYTKVEKQSRSLLEITGGPKDLSGRIAFAQRHAVNKAKSNPELENVFKQIEKLEPIVANLKSEMKEIQEAVVPIQKIVRAVNDFNGEIQYQAHPKPVEGIERPSLLETHSQTHEINTSRFLKQLADKKIEINIPKNQILQDKLQTQLDGYFDNVKAAISKLNNTDDLSGKSTLNQLIELTRSVLVSLIPGKKGDELLRVANDRIFDLENQIEKVEAAIIKNKLQLGLI